MTAVLFFGKCIEPICRPLELHGVVNLIVGYCSASTVDIEAMRGYDANQTYVDSDAKTRVLTLADSSPLAIARDWICDHVRVKPVVH